MLWFTSHHITRLLALVSYRGCEWEAGCGHPSHHASQFPAKQLLVKRLSWDYHVLVISVLSTEITNRTWVETLMLSNRPLGIFIRWKKGGNEQVFSLEHSPPAEQSSDFLISALTECADVSKFCWATRYVRINICSAKKWLLMIFLRWIHLIAQDSLWK